MARLASRQRQKEVRVMNFCWKKMGFQVIGRIPEPGRLEGGDFIPAGKDLCFIGIGMRSNIDAVKYMLQHDLFGTTRVAVVRDELERSQNRMHLDTVFNIVSHNCVLMLDEIMGDESKTRRVVDEYIRDSHYEPYVKVRSDIEFSKFVADEGFHIITVTGDEQLAYGCNALNMGGDRVIAVNASVARKMARDPVFDGTVEFLDFSGVTAMFGAAHCCTQVLRTPSAGFP
eukprot:NODE_570_length_1527_cov_155.816644_g431_i0.p2 GENE.NODE_570_length_1527_cov_155.816644_g431_i0~~NODE_570_length_1527_cov_155.816644_g431_i0.p2  ORF type:complete len:229 (-),score=52.19 NODE_570_length_1527_cov_155.816644_g431_i0:30-716(-)